MPREEEDDHVREDDKDRLDEEDPNCALLREIDQQPSSSSSATSSSIGEEANKGAALKDA